MTLPANSFGQEELTDPASNQYEKMRGDEAAPVAACTIYSVQAVAGIGTAGCAICGTDFGRRP